MYSSIKLFTIAKPFEKLAVFAPIILLKRKPPSTTNNNPTM